MWDLAPRTSVTNCAQLYNICLSQGKRVSVVVVDGITVGHPCCSVYNCHIPLSNNHHRFCPTHLNHDGRCSIIACDLPVVRGHHTCSTPAHQHVEKTYELCGKSRFQLQEHLARARVAHPNDAVGQDVEIAMLHALEAEEEYELNDTGTLALPVLDSGGSMPVVDIGTTGGLTGQPTKRRLKAMFGRQRTHNEQLIVAPCSMIIAHQTFFGAEGVASVVVRINWCFICLISHKSSFPAI